MYHDHKAMQLWLDVFDLMIQNKIFNVQWFNVEFSDEKLL